MGQRRNIVERASAWNQCASGSENTNADAIIQPRDQVFFFQSEKNLHRESDNPYNSLRTQKGSVYIAITSPPIPKQRRKTKDT